MSDSGRGSDAPLYNSKIIRNYIRLLAHRYKHIDIHELLQHAGMEMCQVEDDGHWFSQKQVNRFHEILGSVTHEGISREAGRYTSSPDSLGLMHQYFISMMGLTALYENMGKFSKKFSKSASYTTKKLAANKVEITVTPNQGVQEEPFQCENRIGFLEGFSLLFNVMPPKVEHPECLFKNGAVCKYIVTWQESPSGRLRKIRNILYMVLIGASILAAVFLPIQTALTMVSFFLIAGLAAGWYTDKNRIRELQNVMDEITASSNKKMEQASVNYDNSLLINEVSRALGKEHDVKGVLEEIVDIMQRRLFYDRGLILMTNRSKKKLIFHSGYGFSADEEDFLKQADFALNDPERKTIFSQAYIANTPISLDDVTELAQDSSSQNYAYINKMKSSSIICCPLVHEKEVLGVLAVDNTDTKKQLYQQDINLLMGISSQIASRIHSIILQYRLRQTQKMEAVGSLAGGVAHDFNNILTTILGYSELILNQFGVDDPLRDKIEAIYSAGERAARLTKQLLAFSRNQVMEMNVIDLNGVVSEMAKMLRRLIGEDVEMKLILSESVEPILADISQVEQVLLNLAINARDAMVSGGRLIIETRKIVLTEENGLFDKHMPSGTYAHLMVTDTGEGMKEAIRERIFEPFFTTKSADKGTGLGLSTVYGIVKQHKGHINVYSEIGKGTSFSIYFPIASAAVKKQTTKDAIQPVPGKATLLVVDDDVSIKELVGNILEPLGYKVLVASNGKEALELSEGFQETIDLLLTDVVMPGMNGRQLIRLLQKDRPRLKAVLMSGYPADIVSQKTMVEPGYAFISKPFTPIALTTMIQEVLAAKEESKPEQEF